MSELDRVRWDHDRGGWDAIPATLWTDTRINANAVRFLGWVNSRPSGWIYREGAAIEATGIGRSAIRAAIRQLEDAGYLHRDQERQLNGSFGTVRIRTALEPVFVAANPQVRTDDRLSVDGSADDGSTDDGSRPSTQTDNYSDGVDPETKADKPAEQPTLVAVPDGDASVTASFEEFWKRYPKRPRKDGRLVRPGTKELALARWRKLSASQRARAEAKLAAYTVAADGYPVNVEVWLNPTSSKSNFTCEFAEEADPVPEPRPSPQRYEDCHPEAQAAMDDYDRKWKTGRFADHA